MVTCRRSRSRLLPGQWAVQCAWNSTSPRWPQRASTTYADWARSAVASENNVTTRLVIALVISRFDFCSSLLVGLPLCTTEPLQLIQNAAAPLIFELSPSEHTTPSLLQLYWLPIRWRVQFKLWCFMHAVVTGRSPAYLGSIVQRATQSRSGLRPSSFDFSVPKTRTKFGQRAFSYAGPSTWNTLPRNICETVESASFTKLLKTHYRVFYFRLRRRLIFTLFYLRFTFIYRCLFSTEKQLSSVE